MEKEKLRGFIYTVAGALCWGFSGTCCQYLFANYKIDTVWLTAFRMIVGSVILLVVEAIRKKGKIFEIFHHGKDLLKLVMIGIFGLLFCQYAYLAAIRYTDSGTATILQSLNVIMILVVVIIGTIGGFTLFLQGISGIGAEKASLIGCLEPVSASVSAYFWLHSAFGASKLLGFIMILLAVSLSNLKTILKSKG